MSDTQHFKSKCYSLEEVIKRQAAEIESLKFERIGHLALIEGQADEIEKLEVDNTRLLSASSEHLAKRIELTDEIKRYRAALERIVRQECLCDLNEPCQSCIAKDSLEGDKADG